VPGQTLDAKVSDFSLTFGGEHITLPSATATYYLSAEQSGLAVFGPQNDLFVWQFWGPTWANGYGGWMSEMQAVDFHFDHVSVTDPPAAVAEPSLLALWLVVATIALFWWRVRA
jgi:hypothetical protein